MTKPELLRVFVYGTLKPGELYYSTYCEGRVVGVEPAIAYGQLFDLPLGYPAMTSGDQPVYGYLLTFDNSAVLSALDDLEGFVPHHPLAENEYIRQTIEVYRPDQVSLGKAWAYLMSAAQVQQLGGVLLSGGIWTGETIDRSLTSRDLEA